MHDVRVIRCYRLMFRNTIRILREYDMAVARGDTEYTSYRSQKFMWLTDFDVLLTVHLSIILVINQLNAQILVL